MAIGTHAAGINMQPVVGLDQSVREDVEKLRKSDKVRLVSWL